MRLLRSVALVALCTLGFAATASAVLAPAKPSQLSTVYGFGSCPIPGFAQTNSVALSLTVRADGTTGPFVIPPKQVFVMTDATLTTSGEPANDAMLSLLAVGTAGGGSAVALRYDTVAPGGTVTSVLEFQTGIAVKSASVMCAEMINSTHAGPVYVTAVVHGYFASDK